VAALLIAVFAGFYVSYGAWSLARAYEASGQEYVSDEIYYVDSARRILRDILSVNVSENAFSGKTNPDYYNLEHPPLGKYIISISIMLFGDNPLAWRLPSIIEAGLIPLLVFAAFARKEASHAPLLAGTAGALAAASDRILVASGSLAMLDIHLAFFGTLALTLALRGHGRLASIAAGLATAVKYSGAAFVVAVAVIRAWRSGRAREWILAASETILLSVAAFAITLLPLALYFGPERIAHEIVAGLGWHTTPRPEGPPTSTPAGWIFNLNPFYFTYNYVAVGAELTTPLHLYAIAVAPLLVLAASCHRSRGRCIISGPALYFSVLGIYVLVILLGNNTLYSFYAVQLTPGAAASVAASLLAGECIGRRRGNDHSV